MVLNNHREVKLAARGPSLNPGQGKTFIQINFKLSLTLMDGITPCMVSHNLSFCLSVINFDPNYLGTGTKNRE